MILETDRHYSTHTGMQAIYLPLRSSLLVLLTALAAGAGLGMKNLYRDNAFVQTAWRANDWVTTAVVLPAFVITLLLSTRSLKARLIFIGLTGYLFYNYAFYLFGAAFNKVFLLYAAIVLLSAVMLITALIKLPVQNLLPVSKAVRWVSFYLFIIAIMLCMVELLPALQFIITGTIPAIIKATNHPTSIVYALDLTLVVPVSVLAGVWLWKQEPWGVVLAAIMLVKGAAYGLVLCAGTVLLLLRHVATDPLLPFYMFIAVGGLAGLVWLLKQVPVNH